MSLLDVFTGGKSDEATDALKRAEQYFSGVQVPTLQQLTLPQLQKYVEAGIISPAEAQAYLQQDNAYANEKVDETGTAAQVNALNRLSEVTDAGDMGTPSERAAMDAAEQNMNRAEAGQRGAIEQGMAARGTPYALIQAALENQTVGQEGQQAHMDAVNAQASAYQEALNALSLSGQMGNQLQGQRNTQANTVANAANAMQQFNAQNQQQNAQFNAGNQQSANMANAANRQQVSNNNTGLSNARTQYNAQLPQQVFSDSMAKAQGQAGAATNIGDLYQKQGQQNAGITSGLIDLGTSFIPKPAGAGASSSMGGAVNPTTSAMNQSYQQGWYAHGGIVRTPRPPMEPIDVGSSRGAIDPTPYMANGGYVDHDHSICMAHGGYCMAEGGQVPGDAPFPGDTTSNDVIDAHLSPGEAVIPRSVVSQNPDVVSSLLGGNDQNSDVQDVATILKALRSIRTGAAI